MSQKQPQASVATQLRRKLRASSETTAQTIASEAMCFAIASDILTKEWFAQSARGEEPTTGTPSAMCASFSVEMYLKCISVLDGLKPARGHEPLKLFNELQTSTQTRIAKSFSQSYSFESPHRERLEKALNWKRSKCRWIQPTLRNVLRSCGNPFQEVRYLHENPNDVPLVANGILMTFLIPVLKREVDLRLHRNSTTTC